MTLSEAPVELPALEPGAGRPFGLYLHVPFCITRCGYCDFNTYTPAELGGVNPDAWMLALRTELELAAARLNAPTVDTVFVGGGTPSLLGGQRVARLLDMVREHFTLAPDAEATVEANPESAWPDFFEAARAAGYTRVSLGMQSVSPRVLGVLDRIHTPNRSADSAREALAAGFEHVSLDLIYGTPGESDDDLLRSVDTALATGVDHVSAYALVVEEAPRWPGGSGAVSWRLRTTTSWRTATNWSTPACRRPGWGGTRCPTGLARAVSAGTTSATGTAGSGGARDQGRTAMSARRAGGMSSIPTPMRRSWPA